MDWYVGTSGYSYPAWKGVLYPEDLPPAHMLDYYAGRLNAVEINNMFCRLPKQEVVRFWGEQVAPEFRHPSWHDEAVRRLLEGRDAAVVCSDADDTSDDEAIVSTASWGYLRLRRASYGASELADWAKMAEEFLALNRP